MPLKPINQGNEIEECEVMEGNSNLRKMQWCFQGSKFVKNEQLELQNWKNVVYECK
jgi:hypothetical protein